MSLLSISKRAKPTKHFGGFCWCDLLLLAWPSNWRLALSSRAVVVEWSLKGLAAGCRDKKAWLVVVWVRIDSSDLQPQPIGNQKMYRQAFYLITIRCFYQLTVFSCFLDAIRCRRARTEPPTCELGPTPVCFRPCTHLSYPWSIDRCRLAGCHGGNSMFVVDAATSVTTSLICSCEMEVVPLQTSHSMLVSQQQIQVVVEANDGTREMKPKLAIQVTALCIDM